MELDKSSKPETDLRDSPGKCVPNVLCLSHGRGFNKSPIREVSGYE